MKSKTAGFTLIEIMVVVIIMGLLAAVAVPKLFGSVAKAKATEIAPAAAMYQKLQDVYAMEKGAVGSWKSIGYIAPGDGHTNNFTYCGGEITEDISLDNFGENAKVGWQATNSVSLNDCPLGSWWFVSVKHLTGNQVEYITETNSASCIALAKPNWSVASRTGVECGVAGNSTEETSKEPVNLASNTHAEKGTWRADNNIYLGVMNQTDGNSKNRRGTWNDEEGSNGLYKLEPNSTYTFTIPFEQGTDLSTINSGALVYNTSELKDGKSVANDSGWRKSTDTGEKEGKNGDKSTTTAVSYDLEKNTITMTIKTSSKQDSYYFAANFRSEGTKGQTLSNQLASIETAIKKVTLTKVESKEETKD